MQTGETGFALGVQDGPDGLGQVLLDGEVAKVGLGDGAVGVAQIGVLQADGFAGDGVGLEGPGASVDGLVGNFFLGVGFHIFLNVKDKLSMVVLQCKQNKTDIELKCLIKGLT